MEKTNNMTNQWDSREVVRHLAGRQSVRSFSDESIAEDILECMIDAGIHGASGGNLQAYSVILERDRRKSEKLSKILGYKFIADAAANFIFLIDWHKMSEYAKAANAPFTANRSAFLMAGAWDETIMCAQIMESCARLYGIGACYVGHVHEKITELSQIYHLPDMTFPVIMLSMGYPKKVTPKRKKLDKDMVVFEGRYPDFPDNEIYHAYEEKYRGSTFKLPADSQAKMEILLKFRRALETTYPNEKVEEIIRRAEETGYLSEIQRLFGLHYHAADTMNTDIIGELRKKNLGV